jgi:WD40 repeat protein
MIADQSQISLATYGSSDSTVITIGEDLTIKDWNAFTGKQIRENLLK